MVRLTYKPSSVFDNHLSRIIVANNLKRLSDWRATIMSLSLASDGVYITTYVATSVVSFYLAFPPLHYINNAVYFCCTFLKVAFTGN